MEEKKMYDSEEPIKTKKQKSIWNRIGKFFSIITTIIGVILFANKNNKNNNG